MTIALKPEQERIIQEQMVSGRFQSVEEVVDTALSTLAHQEDEQLKSGDEAVRRMIDFAETVSILRLSMVRLSTPVARTPKCPAVRIEKSRSVTFRQSLRAIALLPPPRAWPRARALPEIKPPPTIAMFSSSSPQIRLLCQWLWPKS